jgi:hypothetical protein
MIIEESAPVIPGGIVGRLLVGTFPMMTPSAPASCAFFTFTVKLQVPRSMNAMLPEIAPAFVSAEQPSVLLGPAPSAGSNARTTLAVIPGDDNGAPNTAVPMV